MQTWAKRGIQTALVTGGLLVFGAGVASAHEGPASLGSTGQGAVGSLLGQGSGADGSGSGGDAVLGSVTSHGRHSSFDGGSTVSALVDSVTSHGKHSSTPQTTARHARSAGAASATQEAPRARLGDSDGSEGSDGIGGLGELGNLANFGDPGNVGNLSLIEDFVGGNGLDEVVSEFGAAGGNLLGLEHFAGITGDENGDLLPGTSG
jgi:hypothetical protein